MKTKMGKIPGSAKTVRMSSAARGFSLIELMVAMAVFVVVAGTAFTLFGKHEEYAVRQEGLSGVNIGLRNAIAQMQMDLSGAGQNLLATAPGAAPPFSLGVIVQNNMPGTAAACTPAANTWAYPVPSACYDGFMIPGSKGCAVLTLTAGLALSSNTSMSTTDNNVGANLTSDAACFRTGDELLVLTETNTETQQTCNSGGEQSIFCMSVVTLTSNAQALPAASPTSITLSYNPPASNGGPSGCPGASCSDSLGIIYQAYGNGGNNFANALMSNTFPVGTYVVDLGAGASEISYAVQPNPSDATDAQLVRCTAPLALCTAATGQILTDEVIGFKVGAALWDNEDSEDIASYFYNASVYCNGTIPVAAPTNCTTTPPPMNDANDYTLVRSIRISMIGRTKPQADQTLTNFHNGFDNGPYLVQQASVAVDIRSMSNSDFGN